MLSQNSRSGIKRYMTYNQDENINTCKNITLKYPKAWVNLCLVDATGREGHGENAQKIFLLPTKMIISCVKLRPN